MEGKKFSPVPQDHMVQQRDVQKLGRLFDLPRQLYVLPGWGQAPAGMVMHQHDERCIGKDGGLKDLPGSDDGGVDAPHADNVHVDGGKVSP